MPYKLRITEEEVREELANLGFPSLPDETVATFKKDLLKLIKADIKELRRKRAAGEISASKSSDPIHNHPLRLVHSQPQLFSSTPSSTEGNSTTSSIPTSAHGLLLRQQQKYRRARDRERSSDSESGYSETGSSTLSSRSECSEATATSSSGVGSSQAPETVDGRTRQPSRAPPAHQRRAPSLPPYPSRPDPVSLYHYYRAHWDKRPPPGEDPHMGLRWKVRSDLFYSK